VGVFAVPLLHTISAAGEYGEKVHQFLGIFAVPVLLFISGFFSKDIEKARRKAVRSLLCPYLICQSIYLLVAALSLKFRLITSTPISTSILAPSGPFYYLLVLFILRYFIADLSRLRYPLAISIIVGLVGGIDTQLNFTGALQATFVLAPFFLGGYYIREEFIHALRKIPVVIPMLLLIGVTAACYVYPVSGYYMNCYSFYGISIGAGIVSRLAFYFMGTVCILALFRILPKRKCFLTIIGRNSMPVYIISTFLAPQLYYIIAPYLPLSEVNLVAGIYVTGFCLVLVLVSSRECFARLYKGVFQKVESVIFIK
jgi:fucose 4-O-acetylase-like acetyltransferase